MSNMVVQTNVLALNSHRYMKQVGQAQSKASARLSSGYKINSAADDAAGLAISEKMRAQIRGLDQASKNSQDAISLIQTAEGGMQEIDNMLQRIRELVVSVSNDTNENNTEGTGDRQKIQDEIDQLVAEIDSMSERVEFNKKKVINGSYADTALQLKNAKAEYDRASLAKVENDAKVSAYKTDLGTTNDSTLDSTAYGALNKAQEDVDKAVPSYKEAVKAYTTAETAYKEAKLLYQSTKATMDTQLSDNNVVAGQITNAMLDKDSSSYISADFAAAFKAYQAASNDWGIEGIGFDKEKVTAANKVTSEAFTGVATEGDVKLAEVRTAYEAYTSAVADTTGTPAADYLALDFDGEKRATYLEAKDALTTALAGKTLTPGANAVTTADVYADDDLAAAFAAYSKAADAYGIDELDVANSDMAKTEALNSALKVTVPTTPAIAEQGTAAQVYASLGSALTVANIQAVEAYLVEDATTTGTGSKKANFESMANALSSAISNVSTIDFTTLTDITYASLSASDQTKVTDLADAIDKYVAASNAYGLNSVGGSAITGATLVGGNSGTMTNALTALNALTAVTTTTTNIAAITNTNTTPEVGKAAALYVTATTTNNATVADIAKIKDFNATSSTDLSVLKNNYDTTTTGVTVYTTGKTNAQLNADFANGTSTTLSDYAAAANAWGFDGVGLATNIDQYALKAPKASWVPQSATTAASPVSDTAAAAYNMLSAANQTLVNDVIAKADKLDSYGEFAKFKVADEVFSVEERAYNELVAARDAKQTTVDDLNNKLKLAQNDKIRSDILYSVGVSKYDTAKNAVEDNDSNPLYFQVGANAAQGLEMSIGSVKSDVLGIGDGKGVTNIDVVKDTGLDTTALLDVLDSALSYVTTERSRLGAAQNRLEYTIKSLDISSENLSAAESRIRDTDMAKEMMELTKANTLQQASISMLAQANQAPQSVLQLLG